jgi:hypothetical protein
MKEVGSERLLKLGWLIALLVIPAVDYSLYGFSGFTILTVATVSLISPLAALILLTAAIIGMLLAIFEQLELGCSLLRPAQWIIVAAFFFSGNLIGATPSEVSSTRRWVSRLRIQSILSVGILVLTLLLLSRSVPLLLLVGWIAVLVMMRKSLPRIGSITLTPLTTRLGTFALVVVSSVLSLVLLEVGARFYLGRPSTQSDLLVYHPGYIHTIPPSTTNAFPVRMPARRTNYVPYTISEQGLRDRVYGPKGPEEIRIALLGDSFAMGYGLRMEESISRRMEYYLREAGIEQPISVINAGCHAVGPWQELAFFKERVEALEPDIVIHEFFCINDISETLLQTGEWLDAYDSGFWRQIFLMEYDRLWQVSAELAMKKKSSAYQLLQPILPYKPFVLKTLNDLRIAEPAHMPRMPDNIGRPYWIEGNLAEYYPVLKQGWRQMIDDSVSIRDYCTQNGFEHYVFAQPDDNDVNDKSWEHTLSNVNDGSAYIQRGALLRTEKSLTEAGLNLIQVWPLLAAQTDIDEIFYSYDGHMKPLGADIVAWALARRIVLDSLSKTFDVPPPVPIDGGIIAACDVLLGKELVH